jgi:hypothetical protein
MTTIQSPACLTLSLMQSILLAMHTITLSREIRNKDEAEKVKSHVFLASRVMHVCCLYALSLRHMEARSNELEAQDKTIIYGLSPT